jgi:Zn-dependent peptidase ImmA (M78 family)
MNRPEITQKVQAIIEKLGVEQAPVPVEDAAKLLNIKIVEYDKFASNFSGTLVKGENITVLGINPTHSQIRRRFTIAHEIGHYLLGHDIRDVLEENLERPPNLEREANMFAGELLMPKEFLKKDIKAGISTVPDLAKKYNVSEQAMTIRLLETNLINEMN